MLFLKTDWSYISVALLSFYIVYTKYRLVDCSFQCNEHTKVEYIYTYMYISGFLFNDMSLSTGSKLVLWYFLSYITVFAIFLLYPAEPGRSRHTLSAMGAESCGKGDRPQCSCSHSADFFLVPTGISVLQPCTHRTALSFLPVIAVALHDHIICESQMFFQGTN